MGACLAEASPGATITMMGGPIFISRGGTATVGDKDTLYKNIIGDNFMDVTEFAKVDDTNTTIHPDHSANTWSAVWGDYDNDGWLDLFVTSAGDNDSVTTTNKNFLYHNDKNGKFTDQAADLGVQMDGGDEYSRHKTAAWVDYNNDGFLDLVVKDGLGVGSNLNPGKIGKLHLFRNSRNNNHFLKINLKSNTQNVRGRGARYGAIQSRRRRIQKGIGRMTAVAAARTFEKQPALAFWSCA